MQISKLHIVISVFTLSILFAVAYFNFKPDIEYEPKVKKPSQTMVADTSPREETVAEEMSTIEPSFDTEDIVIQRNIDSLKAENSYPKSMTLDLTDNISVEVDFQLDDFAKLNALLTQLQNHEHLYEFLTQASEAGVSSASLEVYRLLRDCNDLANNPDRFNAYYAEQISIACRNITQQQIDDRELWVDKGVEQGAFGALAKRAFELRGVDAKGAYDLDYRAWESGHTGTTLAISSHLKQGIPGINDGKPDLIRAYAFALIHASIEKAAMSQGGRPIDPNILVQMDQYMAVQSAQLDIHQLAEAQLIAQQLLEENKNCCVNLWRHYE